MITLLKLILFVIMTKCMKFRTSMTEAMFSKEICNKYQFFYVSNDFLVLI